MILETGRLILRPWDESDAESLYKYNIAIKETVKQKYLEVSYLFDGKTFITKNDSAYNVSKLANVICIPGRGSKFSIIFFDK